MTVKYVYAAGIVLKLLLLQWIVLSDVASALPIHTFSSSVHWQNGCNFNLTIVDIKTNIKLGECTRECIDRQMCSHFSHDGTKCFLMLGSQSAQPITEDKKWTCGFLPMRNWQNQSADHHEGILVQSNCTFRNYESPDTDAVSNGTILFSSSCQKACLQDHRCNVFSHDKENGLCVIEQSTSYSLPSGSISASSECAVISNRIWQQNHHGGILYSTNCNFDGYDIDNEPRLLKNEDDCVSYCLNNIHCTHFSYYHHNETCYIKNVPVSTIINRVPANGGYCGYISDRLNPVKMSNRLTDWVITLIILAVFVIVLIFIVSTKHKKRAIAIDNKEHLERILQGDGNASIDPSKPLDEQIPNLPYDNRWEFPKNQIKFEKELGTGAFGRLVHAEAIGLNLGDESFKTVAVRMSPSKLNIKAVEVLVNEIKIHIHLGAHVNVIRFLGASTTNISKGDVWLIMEYCHNGSLQNYLLKNRENFISQVDGYGNYIVDAIEPTSNRNCDIISTCDLIRWSFEIARGMEYLVNQKVLHGYLAARNIFLTEDLIAKVSDFGLARQRLQNVCNYKEKRKWMAIETLRNGIYSSQSNVWSFGVVLWEIFSLAAVPYPGLKENECLLDYLLGMGRMSRPFYASNDIYGVITRCWREDANERPTFPQLQQEIISQMQFFPHIIRPSIVTRHPVEQSID